MDSNVNDALVNLKQDTRVNVITKIGKDHVIVTVGARVDASGYRVSCSPSCSSRP